MLSDEEEEAIIHERTAMGQMAGRRWCVCRRGRRGSGGRVGLCYIGEYIEGKMLRCRGDG